MQKASCHLRRHRHPQTSVLSCGNALPLGRAASQPDEPRHAVYVGVVDLAAKDITILKHRAVQVLSQDLLNVAVLTGGDHVPHPVRRVAHPGLVPSVRKGRNMGTGMQVETLILGAGAAGLFCAAHAGADVLVVDHAKAPAEKIRISGGGRCNFTNLRTGPANFISANAHFAKSALSRYTPQDFLTLVEAHGIPWHEKTLGQLFCDRSARDIITMLTGMCDAAGVRLWLETVVEQIAHDGSKFRVTLSRQGRTVTVTARHLVVATGGKSIPKMGATGIAYRIAEQFGLAVTETQAALVPFTFADNPFALLTGTAQQVIASAGGQQFAEAMLFTHRGLSGPAMLQISSYWHEGEAISVDLTAGTDVVAMLKSHRRMSGKKALRTVLSTHLTARLADFLSPALDGDRQIGTLSDAAIAFVAQHLTDWRLRPSGTEGYRTAEVTLGGVDTEGLSSRTMMAKAVPGLFFVGECVDVTGWLGGYNFQWAWASGFAAGTAIAGGY
jgi:predicted Rossmann fold flavoprotein